MNIRIAEERAADRWDDFIKPFASSGPFHTRAWTDCFRCERLTPIYLRLLSKDQPIGGIAGLVIEPETTILRRIDRRIMFCSGPALSEMSSALIQDCMLALKRYAEDQGLTSLICLHRDYPYAYDWGAARVHLDVIHEYIIDLRGRWEDVRARMRRSIPEQARKGERSGLTFHEYRDASMLPQLLRLIENTRSRRMRKDGIHFSPYYIPHLTEKSLVDLSESALARFLVARRGAEVLCILLVFAFGKRAYALLIGCSEEGYERRAPAFVWLNAMGNLKGAGIEYLNLAAAGAGSTLGFAKVSLGAERQACTGCVSPYLQGPVSNLLFQIYRWKDNLSAVAPLVRRNRSSVAKVFGSFRSPGI